MFEIWRHAQSIMYLLLLFASLGTLYEPSSGTQILTIVYNDTLIAKEMSESVIFFFFFFFFFYQQCGLPPGKSQGLLFQTTGFKLLKPVSIGFSLVKIILYFSQILNVRMQNFLICNLLECWGKQAQTTRASGRHQASD